MKRRDFVAKGLGAAAAMMLAGSAGFEAAETPLSISCRKSVATGCQAGSGRSALSVTVRDREPGDSSLHPMLLRLRIQGHTLMPDHRATTTSSTFQSPPIHPSTSAFVLSIAVSVCA